MTSRCSDRPEGPRTSLVCASLARVWAPNSQSTSAISPYAQSIRSTEYWTTRRPTTRVVLQLCLNSENIYQPHCHNTAATDDAGIATASIFFSCITCDRGPCSPQPVPPLTLSVVTPERILEWTVVNIKYFN